jgi:tetratricopeptide (TPR) repeat protein
MRRPPARSRPTGLMALALCALAATPCPPARGQDAGRTPASNADAEMAKRVDDLEKTISQQVDAGRIAEAIPPAQERLDLLVRLRGKDHWETGDARRDVETYEHLAARPRAVQDRFAEAQRAIARGEQFYGQGQYARASEAFQEALAIGREILPEGHPSIGESYNNLAETLRDQMKHAEAEAMHRRALAIALKARPEGHPYIASS